MTYLNHARAVLDRAGQQHLAALAGAAGSGTPAAELLYDVAGFYSAAGQLLALRDLRDEPTRALPLSVAEPAR